MVSHCVTNAYVTSADPLYLSVVNERGLPLQGGPIHAGVISLLRPLADRRIMASIVMAAKKVSNGDRLPDR